MREAIFLHQQQNKLTIPQKKKIDSGARVLRKLSEV